MFRRCVSALVLLGFIAGQLAVFSHAHSGYSAEEQREHDARSHVHLGGHSHHSHSHPGHSHNHSTDPLNGDQMSNPGLGLVFEHDADAIYLPIGVSALIATKDQATQGNASSNISADTTPLRLFVSDASAPIRPLDAYAPGAKLYLTLRTLRI